MHLFMQAWTRLHPACYKALLESWNCWWCTYLLGMCWSNTHSKCMSKFMNVFLPAGCVNGLQVVDALPGKGPDAFAEAQERHRSYMRAASNNFDLPHSGALESPSTESQPAASSNSAIPHTKNSPELQQAASQLAHRLLTASGAPTWSRLQFCLLATLPLRRCGVTMRYLQLRAHGPAVKHAPCCCKVLHSNDLVKCLQVVQGTLALCE